MKGHSIRLGERGRELLKIFEELDGDSYSLVVSKALSHYGRLRLDMATWSPDNEDVRQRLREALRKPGR